MSDLFGETKPIKALSLWQPWASLVAAGVKLHETRHWQTAYRGPVAIHAAKTFDFAGAPDELCAAVFGPYWARLLPLGAVVAVANLVDCHPAERVADYLTEADRTAGNFARGRFAWRLDTIRPVTIPMPLTGRQGLFNWTPPADLETHLGFARDHAAACRKIGWHSPSGQRNEAA